MSLPLSFSASSGPAVSGNGPQDGEAFFKTGTFTASAGKGATATGGCSVCPWLILGGVAVWFLFFRKK